MGQCMLQQKTSLGFFLFLKKLDSSQHAINDTWPSWKKKATGTWHFAKVQNMLLCPSILWQCCRETIVFKAHVGASSIWLGKWILTAKKVVIVWNGKYVCKGKWKWYILQDMLSSMTCRLMLAYKFCSLRSISSQTAINHHMTISQIKLQHQVVDAQIKNSAWSKVVEHQSGRASHTPTKQRIDFSYPNSWKYSRTLLYWCR